LKSAAAAVKMSGTRWTCVFTAAAILGLAAMLETVQDRDPARDVTPDDDAGLGEE
jgi:hypothetical protein